LCIAGLGALFCQSQAEPGQQPTTIAATVVKIYGVPKRIIFVLDQNGGSVIRIQVG